MLISVYVFGMLKEISYSKKFKKIKFDNHGNSR